MSIDGCFSFLQVLPVFAASVWGECALPPFHESWTPAEQAAVREFAARWAKLAALRRQTLNADMRRTHMAHAEQVRKALHAAVRTGNAGVGMEYGETLARVAAYVACPMAAKAFVAHGSNPMQALSDGTDSLSELLTAVVELICSSDRDICEPENGGAAAPTDAQRVGVLQWLVERGTDLKPAAESIWVACALSMMAGHELTSEWVLSQDLPAPQEAGHISLLKRNALTSTVPVSVLRKMEEKGILSKETDKTANGAAAVQILAGRASQKNAAEKMRYLLERGYPLQSPGEAKSPLALAWGCLEEGESGGKSGAAAGLGGFGNALAVADLLLGAGCRLQAYPPLRDEAQNEQLKALLRRHGIGASLLRKQSRSRAKR